MYKILKENKIIGVSEDYPVLLDEYEVIEDKEHSVNDYIQIQKNLMEQCEYLLKTDEKAISYMKDKERETRDSYLEKYVDPVVSNPLRWNDMSEEEKKEYSDYRKYLLDYPETENWYEQNPKTFEEWK